jgi:hypothetical protein
MGVAVAPHLPGQAAFMTLSGPQAFTISSREPRRNSTLVMPLALDQSRLKLRLDPMATFAADTSTAEGKLFLVEGSAPQIGVVYGDLEQQQFQNAVSLGGWSVDRLDPPFMSGFVDWRISYIDSVGEWIDLVVNSGKAPEETK